MPHIALVSDSESLPTDHDMIVLQEALDDLGLNGSVTFWDCPDVEWAKYDLILIRSPWSYIHRRADFINWAGSVSQLGTMENPVGPAQWSLDKTYLLDLAKLGVPIVPTRVLPAGISSPKALERYIASGIGVTNDFVLKPSVGASSHNVRRFSTAQFNDAFEHYLQLRNTDGATILQSYVPTIETLGELNLVFFGGRYSHAIRKSPLLHADGRVELPTLENRSVVSPTDAEILLGEQILESVRKRFLLQSSLLYGRLDLVRTDDRGPVVLELEICEPSLSLTLHDRAARRFAVEIVNRVGSR